MSSNSQYNSNISFEQPTIKNGGETEYKPLILNLNIEKDFSSFKHLSEKAIIVDEIYEQLKELIKNKNPKIKFSLEEYSDLIHDYLKGTTIEKYGLWIFYPWSNKLIHTVHENEFIELRTIRNCYKITPEEQDRLRRKVIGIVGLSVGHAIAVTVASERICGELRLADDDILELTNLNRIKTGIQNLGIKKTIIAAREIAEIDPFIKVKCYHDGINDENILNFLHEDGKLDLCMEECDNFYIKFALRYKCRDFHIPVLMNTSDRGLIDIERFDLDTERKIFHGLSTTTNIESLRNLSTEEKIPFLYEILNENDMSVRLKASLIEIDETIKGWPQLSSAVTYGSGMITDVARRVLLGYLKKSGRFSVDLEEIINNDIEQEQDYKPKEFNSDIIRITPKRESPSASSIDQTIIKNIVSDAICAPSAGNAQPWKWISKGESINVTLDTKRISPWTDFNNWASIFSLGCSVENAIISAFKNGFSVKLRILETKENDFSAELILNKKNGNNTENIDDPDLSKYINLRQTNRKLSIYKPLSHDHKKELTDAVISIPNASIQLIEKRPDIAKVADIVAEGDVIRFLNKFLHREVMNEIRWNKIEAIDKPYGIEIDSLEISQKDKIGLKMFKPWSVASFVKKIGGKALGDMSRKQILDSSALALISMPALDKNDFFFGGRAVERFWLTATKNHLSVHPFVALLYFFMRLEKGETECFDEKEVQTLRTLRRRWKEIFNPSPGFAEMFLCRLFYSEPSTENSKRIPETEVLEFL